MTSALNTQHVQDRFKSVYRHVRTRHQLRRLAARGDRVALAVSAALSDVLEKRFTEDERAWVNRIESLRETLSLSADELTVTDYGAVTADAAVTSEAMYRGTVVTRTVGEITAAASKYPLWASVWFKLVRHLRPAMCLELGTSLGISTAYQAAALELNGTGRIVTLEGAQPVARLATANFAELGLERIDVEVGRFEDRLDAVLRASPALDYVFIDGQHEKQATLGYFRQIRPFLSRDGVMVFDDISWSKGMQEAWAEIQHDPAVKLSVDLVRVGLCSVAPVGAAAPQRVRPKYFVACVLDRYAARAPGAQLGRRAPAPAARDGSGR